MLIINHDDIRLINLKSAIEDSFEKDKIFLLHCRDYEDVNLLFNFLEKLGAGWPDASQRWTEKSQNKNNAFVFKQLDSFDNNTGVLSLTFNARESPSMDKLIIRYSVRDKPFYDCLSIYEKQDYIPYEF